MNKIELIKKYDQQGPRYTSYPPVPFWTGAPDINTWLNHVAENSQDGIDLYIHIPYCQKLCWYCGCNREISKDLNKGEDFVAQLLQEWKFYQENISAKLNSQVKINSIHLGGGTPNFLKAEYLETLFQELSLHFNENFFGSIEIDPRTISLPQIKVFSDYGFKRISMGIQDFDPAVQKAINREQSFELVTEVVKTLRQFKFESINFDLIFGLPKQTPESIQNTIGKVMSLDPDMIAFYSYAHLPEKLTNQRLILEKDLPTGEYKRELYEIGKGLLVNESKMIEIGMDHFAKLGSYLANAYNEGKLLRNFMGYTDKKSKVLLGLGPTAISSSGQSFVQNEKELDLYREKILNKGFAYSQGHTHSDQDKLVEEIIQNIMCQNTIGKRDLEKLDSKVEIENELQAFLNDGVLSLRQDNAYQIPNEYRFLLRNICMAFDHHLKNFKKVSQVSKFSRTV